MHVFKATPPFTFWQGKNWPIWQIECCLPIFYPPIISVVINCSSTCSSFVNILPLQNFSTFGVYMYIKTLVVSLQENLPDCPWLENSLYSQQIFQSLHISVYATYILNNSKDSYHTITHNVTLNITYYFITTSSHNIHHNTAILVIIVSTEPISEQHANQLPRATLQCQVIDDKRQTFILIIMERLLFAPCIQMLHLSFTSLQCGRLKE